jgi:DNA repair photolyase
MELIEARSIFSPATGFIARGGFDWTCNPYVGCVFGCTYCYAMFMPQNRRPKAEWGRWLTAKRNAIDLAERSAHKTAGAAVYISSVTDPYQPVERSLGLTRGILEALAPHQPRLLIQTRGPLVVRDADVLMRFHRIRVNVSIPTDNEEVRRQFEPKAPPLERRWQALNELRSDGIPVGICVTPMLPVADAAGFVARIAEFRPEVLVMQDFHDAGGRVGADTGPLARDLLSGINWTAGDYRAVVDLARNDGLATYEGEAGFFPP